VFGQRSVNDSGQFLLAERMREVDEFLIHRDSYLTFRHTNILPTYRRSDSIADRRPPARLGPGPAGRPACEVIAQRQDAPRLDDLADRQGIDDQPGGQRADLERRGLWLPAAALAGEGPKPRLPRVPGVHDGSVGDDVVQRATITLQQDAQEP
jgi:hypothetical protein